MNRLSRVLVLAGILYACAHSSGKVLKCATWNLQNYLVQNRYEEGVFRLNHPMPERRKQKIREQILSLRPDVLFLQEIGSKVFLNELRLDLGALGLNYAYAGFSGVDETSRGLAWLSTIPPRSSVFHHPVSLQEKFPEMKRGIQEITLDLDGRLVTFLHVHLKSRFSEDPEDPDSRSFRRAELAALASVATGLAQSRQEVDVFITGDFNTPFDSELFDGLAESWAPIPAFDAGGGAWTYHHQKSGTRDRIDGFWVKKGEGDACSARLLPASGPVPSDHRMVLLEID